MIGTSQLLLQLPVASFTVVMATGIVSIGAGNAGQDGLASTLRWAAVAMLSLFVGLRGARIVIRRQVITAEFDHPATVFDAFSVVVALTVTVVAFAPQLTAWALVLIWGCAIGLWLCGVVLVLRVLARHGISCVVDFASGRWLLVVVSIESMAVLGTAIYVVTHSAAALDAALCLWAAGLAAYPGFALVIAVRLHRREWRALEDTPDHWISHGCARDQRSRCHKVGNRTHRATHPSPARRSGRRGRIDLDQRWDTLPASCHDDHSSLGHVGRDAPCGHSLVGGRFPLGDVLRLHLWALSCESRRSAACACDCDLLVGIGCMEPGFLDEFGRHHSRAEAGAR